MHAGWGGGMLARIISGSPAFTVASRRGGGKGGVRAQGRESVAGVSSLLPLALAPFPCAFPLRPFLPFCSPIKFPFLFPSPHHHRVFKLKLAALVKDLLDGYVLGRPIGFLHVIEFQKRGLPHAHILLILHPDDKPRNADDYDRIVCAELPDKEKEPLLYNVVTDCLIHGPCGTDNPNSPCMVDGYCSKHYTKDFCAATQESDGYPVYRRRDNGATCTKIVRQQGQPNRPVVMDNRSVVPYNRAMCKKYQVGYGTRVTVWQRTYTHGA